jgi:SPX domain protein involved in polyphosphate accumulation
LSAGGYHRGRRPSKAATRTTPQATLQGNKATFFFRLERELEKVNAFYLQKEAELKLRLKTLVDKKKAIQSRDGKAAGASYITLREGFQLFEHDLSKLQQFVEVNATAFSKILKKVGFLFSYTRTHIYTLFSLYLSIYLSSGTKIGFFGGDGDK